MEMVHNATDQHPVHTYQSGGKYTVSLTTSNAGGSNTTSKIKYIGVIGGNDGIAIFRPSTGYWYFDYNLDGVLDNSYRYGGIGDQIVNGDWLGMRADGIAIFRPASGYGISITIILVLSLTRSDTVELATRLSKGTGMGREKTG